MKENTAPEPTTDKSDPPTMKEIARLAGVSIGTVDRVLHHRGRVSPENMAKIQAIVTERGYRPNVFASRLSGGTSLRTIGVVIPAKTQDFNYWQLIQNGMERAAQEVEPLRVRLKVMEFDRYSTSDCTTAFRDLLSLGCDALALAPIQPKALRPLIDGLDPKLPLVFFDTDMDCAHAHCFVGQDPWKGGVLAGKLLSLSLEPGRPMTLVRFDTDDEHLNQRCEGFLSSAQHLGRQVIELAQNLDHPFDRRRAEMSLFLARHPAVGGFFVPNSSVGEYAQAGLGRKVVGYDLIPANIAALEEGRVDFLLNQRPEVMGYESVRLLSRSVLFREALPQRIGLPLDVILKENIEGHLEGISS